MYQSARSSNLSRSLERVQPLPRFRQPRNYDERQRRPFFAHEPQQRDIVVGFSAGKHDIRIPKFIKDDVLRLVLNLMAVKRKCAADLPDGRLLKANENDLCHAGKFDSNTCKQGRNTIVSVVSGSVGS